MKYKNLKTWAKRLTMLSAVIALIATVYAFGASTPQEALASSHLQKVPPNWSLTPSGIRGGDKFRLIFLSSDKRTATPTNMTTYNNWIIARASSGHADIQQYSAGFTVVGCTAAVDARDNTGTTYTNANKGVPIYWLNGNKVADNYEDFYDGSWDDEINDKNQHGNDGPDTSQSANYPWTGCEHDGTEAFLGSDSESLGNTFEVRRGRPNSSASGTGPLSSDLALDPNSTHPMYGLSQVFQAQPFPSNTGTLTTGGTPRTGSMEGSDTGEYWRVQLAKGIPYQIDVKGSERSQPGGTIENPRIKLLAGSTKLKLVNRRATGVSQTTSETLATGGGIGQNSRLVVKPKQETKYYYLLIHRADGDDGTYTVTVNNLAWPDGRRAPDITVDQENPNNVEISWTKSKKTHNSLVAPPGNYKIEYRRLSDTNWTSSGIVDKSDRAETISSLAANTTYEVRVRMIPPADSTHTYRWGYARVYTTN